MAISLEPVLIIIICLITLNLLFIGFYIVSVLRELKKTISKARQMIDDVDQSVKEGIDKVTAIERPLEALTTTANALAGFLKGADVVKKAAQSIKSLGSEHSQVPQDNLDEEAYEGQTEIPAYDKKPPKKPKLFRR